MAIVFPYNPSIGDLYPVNPGTSGITQYRWDGEKWSAVPSSVSLGTENQSAFNDYQWPLSDGSAGWFLSTNGAAALSWLPIDVGVTKITAGNSITISPTTGVGNVTVTNSGVTSIVAGQNITISPTNGKGAVTVNGSPPLSLIDDISSQFNGSSVTFTLQSGGANLNTTVARLIIAVGGIIQTPNIAFSFNSGLSQITFTSAPPTGAAFAGWSA
jgi:hypothetical protein